jgi:hypothetical protein
MKFLFYVDKHTEQLKFTYDAMVNCAGFSGTETSVLETAKYLVASGHYVVIMIDNEYTDDQIIFWDSKKMFSYDYSDFDVYSPLLFCHSFQAFQLVMFVPKSCLFIWWMHCFPIAYDLAIIDYAKCKGLKIIVVTPSNYVTNHSIVASLQLPRFTVGNGINHAIFASNDLALQQNKTGRFTFHAAFDRGGILSYKVFKKFQNHFKYGSFHTFDYGLGTCDVTHLLKDSSVNFKKALSKVDLHRHLLTCDYFVYTLAYDHGGIHHDTYACCIHEALASGVIVLSWDVACLKSLYGDAIILLEPLHYSTYNSNAPFSANPNLLSDEAVQLLFEKLKYLEENPIEKEKQRKKGFDWALNPIRTWNYQSACFLNICKQQHNKSQFTHSTKRLSKIL